MHSQGDFWGSTSTASKKQKEKTAKKQKTNYLFAHQPAFLLVSLRSSYKQVYYNRLMFHASEMETFPF